MLLVIFYQVSFLSDKGLNLKESCIYIMLQRVYTSPK